MKSDADKMLRDWADRCAHDASQLRALEARIVATYRSGTPSSDRALPRGGTRPLLFNARRRHLLYFVAGIAATLTAAALWQVLAIRSHDLAPLLREESGLFAGRRPSMARVFDESERLFGSNLQWFAQSGHCTGLGVSDAPVAGQAAQAMVVRIAVLRRAGGMPWRRVWVGDVVARPDDAIEWAPEGEPGNHISLWLHRLDSGAALLESRLDLQAPMKMQAETREVLRFGAAATAAHMRRGDVEYLLLQTLAPAGDKPCTS